MKKLEELGISPTPWDYQPNNPSGPIVTDNHNSFVCGGWAILPADARFIGAGPKMYAALYGLLEIVCDGCKAAYMVDGKCAKCPRVKAAEAALAEAAGEEMVDDKH